MSTTETLIDPAASWTTLGPGVEIAAAAATPEARRWLTKDALALVAELQRELGPDRRRLLAARRERQQRWNAGELPGFLDTALSRTARESEWRVAPLPPDLLRRRVEITGPVDDAKMVINMLSRTADGHRADAAMLDFEDSMKPTWDNVVRGLGNVVGAARGTLTFERPATPERPAKTYRLDPDDMPLLMVRCRGLHLDESNLRVDGEPVAAGLLDLALVVVHTARALLERGRTPKYYVPKVEHHLEAWWWNRLFTRLEEALELAPSTLRATFLIETLPAAFQIEEILWELRSHAAGLNVGRWDKIFSDIKTLAAHPDRVLPDRASISLNRPWMMSYARHLIEICHRRGAFALGGMAAFTPGRTPERRAEQTGKVVADKELEASMGHDGCWVSHPYFIAPALAAFPRDNQLDVRPDIERRPDLLPVGGGPRTLEGLRTNVRVGIAYLEGWSRGLGCIAWDDLMEDLATLEISRAQSWQWLHHGVVLDDGRTVTRDLVGALFDQELERIVGELASSLGAEHPALAAHVESFARARAEAEQIFTEPTLSPFLAERSELAGEGGDR